MIVIAVEFTLKPDCVDKFRDRIRRHAKDSLAEAGCLQFDICSDRDDETKCFLFEKYVDDAAFEVHRSADYFKSLGTEIEPWVADKVLKIWTCE